MCRITILVLVSLLAIGLAASPATAQLTDLQELGKKLFFDNNLSTPPGQSCAACHAPNTGWVGPVSDVNAHGAVYPGAIHVRFGNRKPPSSAYASFSPSFHYDEGEGLFVGGVFWDGRADDVVEQAKGPFLNRVEQNNPKMRSVINRILMSDYGGDFLWLYEQWAVEPEALQTGLADLGDRGDPGFVADAYQFMAEAIGAYEASPEVNPFSSKYDAFLRGETSLTADEAWGLELFEGKAMCNACHPSAPGPDNEPPLFTDFTYDNLGVPKNPENPWYDMPRGFNPDGEDWVDYGLGGRLGIPEEMGKVKVPTLRNVGMEPYPGFVQAYTHNGYFKSLKDVVHFYNTRDVLPWPPAEVPENVNDDELGNLMLTDAEEDALVAFMLTLQDGWTGDAEAVVPAVESVETTIQQGLILGRSLPNPFRGSTRIRVEAGDPSVVTLSVFDVQGRNVRTLLSAQDASVPRDVVWDARDDLGRPVAPGMYFYLLRGGGARQVQRVILLP